MLDVDYLKSGSSRMLTTNSALTPDPCQVIFISETEKLFRQAKIIDRK